MSRVIGLKFHENDDINAPFEEYCDVVPGKCDNCDGRDVKLTTGPLCWECGIRCDHKIFKRPHKNKA